MSTAGARTGPGVMTLTRDDNCETRCGRVRTTDIRWLLQRPRRVISCNRVYAGDMTGRSMRVLANSQPSAYCLSRWQP